MDERDKLLRELSNVAKINVVEDPSGQVIVSLDGGILSQPSCGKILLRLLE